MPSRSRDTALLELPREEPVVTSDDHVGGHVGPSLDVARLVPDRVRRRARLRVPLHLRSYVVGQVVEEGPLLVELGVAAGGLLGGPSCRIRAGRAPPPSRRLARQRDHRVEQHDHPHPATVRHHRRREAAQRLRHQDGVGALADGCIDQVGVLGQTDGRVVLRDVDRDRLVATPLELGDQLTPVRRVPARAGDQDERAHSVHLARDRRGRLSADPDGVALALDVDPAAATQHRALRRDVRRRQPVAGQPLADARVEAAGHGVLDHADARAEGAHLDRALGARRVGADDADLQVAELRPVGPYGEHRVRVAEEHPDPAGAVVDPAGVHDVVVRERERPDQAVALLARHRTLAHDRRCREREPLAPSYADQTGRALLHDLARRSAALPRPRATRARCRGSGGRRTTAPRWA